MGDVVGPKSAHLSRLSRSAIQLSKSAMEYQSTSGRHSSAYGFVGMGSLGTGSFQPIAQPRAACHHARSLLS